MYIGTTSPLPRGTRVRIEVNHAQSSFVIEAVVARAVKMPANFQVTGLSGMGVRFLSAEELVASLFVEEGARAPVAADEAGQAESPAPPATPRPRPVVFDARGAQAPDAPEVTAPLRPAAGAADAAANGAFRVTFRDLDHFADVLRRDMLTGGVFVPTSSPPPVHARIVVEIVPPLSGEKPVRILATVVMCRTAAESGPPERPAGVAVAFLDPKAAARALAPLAQKLQG